MMHRMRALLCVASLLVCATPALAKDYLIEAIAFRHTAWGDGAPWQAGVLLPDVEAAVDLDSPDLPAGFEVLGTGPALGDLAVSLGDSSQYPLLSYRAWRQPGLPREAGIPVRINVGPSLQVRDTGKPAPRAAARIGDVSDLENLRVARSTANALITQDSQVVGQLNGTLEVTLGRYLHVETSLVFSDRAGDRSAHYSAHRRMRSRRTHYIDNPLFGLIVHITPIEEADAPDENATAVDAEDAEDTSTTGG